MCAGIHTHIHFHDVDPPLTHIHGTGTRISIHAHTTWKHICTQVYTCTHTHPLSHMHIRNLQIYAHGATHSNMCTQTHMSRCSTALDSEHFGEGPSSGLTFPLVSYEPHCSAGEYLVSEKVCCGLLEFSTAWGWQKERYSS